MAAWRKKSVLIVGNETTRKANKTTTATSRASSRLRRRKILVASIAGVRGNGGRGTEGVSAGGSLVKCDVCGCSEDAMLINLVGRTIRQITELCHSTVVGCGAAVKPPLQKDEG